MPNGLRSNITQRRSSRRVGRALLVVLLGALTFVTLGRVLSARTDVPSDVGLVDEIRLANCGTRANCAMRTFATPTGSDGSAELHQLEAIMTRKGAEIRTEKSNYVHAVFRSRVFRFPDDVQVVIDPTRHQLTLRSASRLGSGDGGVNSSRLAMLATALGLPDVVADTSAQK